MMAKRTIITALALAFALIGCSTTKVAKQKATLAEVRQPLVVQTSGDDKRPSWASEGPFFEDGEALHFAGGYIGGTDYALTLRLAKAEAIKNLLESVEIKARIEFSHAIHGQNRDEDDLGQYVTDAVGWTIDNLKIRGIKSERIYYEQVFEPLIQSFRYNSWVLLRVERTDYEKAKTGAAKQLLDKAIQEKDEEAKARALELLEKLRQGV
jgi:hypothetical protein